MNINEELCINEMNTIIYKYFYKSLVGGFMHLAQN